ncbi:MAG: hypothetical protein U1E76_17110 [Planctomycetota bacterium]
MWSHWSLARTPRLIATWLVVLLAIVGWLVVSTSSRSLGAAVPPFPGPELMRAWHAAERWEEVPAGRLQGTIACCRPRPKQELVVFLVRDGGELVRSESQRHAIGQKGARFEPSFLTIVSGDTVTFVNDEEKEIDHNVYGLGAERFDLGIFPRGSREQHVFLLPGEIALHCSVHKMMDAKLFVAPSAAYAVVDGDHDQFAIERVPAGTYRLRTYQKFKRFRDADQAVTVRAGELASVTIELQR